MLVQSPPPERWNHWMRRRANPRRVWVHPGVIDRLAGDRRLHPGGSMALAPSGLGVAAGEPERFYVRDDDVESVIAEYRLRPDREGQLVLMVVPHGMPVDVLRRSGEPVCTAAALVDLLDSADARDHHAAVSALDDAVRRARASLGGVEA